MHWLEKWRKKYQISRQAFANKVSVSEQLIFNLENGVGYGFTHPQIADAIADFTGATAKQRDSLVHKKHRGTYTPKPKATYFSSKPAEKKEKPQKKPPERRTIVAVSPGAVEMGRYPTLVAAADAHLPCTTTTVANRCARKLSPRVNEFLPYGVTFRYADEWDKMPEWLRKDDMKKAEGARRAYGRQTRKVI